MVRFLKTHLYSVIALVILATVGVSFLINYATTDPLANLITTTVERGTVESLVSVSGITEASNTADLAFAASGVVSKIYVDEGSVVQEGDVLAVLGVEELVALRTSAVADLRVAEANRAELISGDTVTTRDITNTKVAIATAELASVNTAQTVAVEASKRTLLSSDLTARTEDPEERAPAPVITGTYQCDKEGSYILAIYSSGSDSGYSVELSGIETGTYAASTDQPAALGTCGLYSEFTSGAKYSDTTWIINIPNKNSATFTVHKNALAVAETNAKNAITAATQALTLATQEQTATNASPRSEALARANAQIEKASAQIAQIDAQIGNRAIIAPFAGVISSVDIVVGETAPAKPVITVLSTDTIDLTARIPEIDVTSVMVGQSVRIVFDAETTTTLTGTVAYISPLPIQIDGVGYFEVKITLASTPSWLRGGLNADIDIVITSTEDVLRVPKRYIVTTGKESSVRILEGTTIATTSVTKVAEGNDGWVAISGIREGTTVVTP